MRYRSNPAFRRELEATPEFQAAFIGITTVVGAAIKAAALPYRHTGYFLRRIVVVGTRVELRDWGWHFSEFGSIHNPPQRNILRGVKASGLSYRDARNPL